MKRLATLAILAGLLLREIPLPAQDQPPASVPASPSDQPAPGTQPQKTEPAPAAPPPVQPPAQTQPQTPSPADKTNPATTPAKKKRTRTRVSAPGHKVVVRNGGAKDQSAQLAPGMSKEQERHSRETTTQLLATTDANLQSIAGHQLTTAQQSVLDQIHTYIRQSKEASDSGDVARAHSLAYKAHLLSDELRK